MHVKELPDRMLLFTSTLDLVLSLINSITFVLCVQNLMASERQGRPWTTPAQENPADFMDTMREMAHAMQEQVVAIHQMMDQLGKWPEASYEGNPHGPEADLDYLKFAEFRKANSPSF